MGRDNEALGTSDLGFGMYGNRAEASRAVPVAHGTFQYTTLYSAGITFVLR